MIKKIIIEPDPILRKKCKPIEKVDDELRKLMKQMLNTMYQAPGIGLAAIQVGILKRVVVIDISKDERKKEPLFLVNPEITYR
jgi:peptide deformylase